MSKGYRHDPLADIEMIRQNLKDRYDEGFPILKELLQNADDARASFVDFVWSPGIPTATHALLRGPALIAINNGPFTETDQKAIYQMGLSDKLRARDSIGKFGLGLKSIFHWCEAFFFLASAKDTNGDILNPWSGGEGATNLHSEWDLSDSEMKTQVELMQGHLHKVLSGDRWFVLWIPLRQVSHRKGILPILPNYPGDSQHFSLLSESETTRKLAETLPLLANLQRIRILHLSKEGTVRQETRIELLPASKRRYYRREVEYGAVKWKLSGKIGMGDELQLNYYGQEAAVDHQPLKALKKSDYWPSSTRIDPHTAETVEVREKVIRTVPLFFWAALRQGKVSCLCIGLPSCPSASL